MATTILLWTAIAAAAIASSAAAASSIGVNWGTQMSHPIHPKIVVKMLQDNGIKKVKLFDADSWTMSALSGTDIEVMVAIPNDMLQWMSEDYGHAKDWVKENVTAYHGKVNIKYVAVGNEPFLTSYNGSFLKTTLPSLKNIQRALDEANVGDRIKGCVPLNADVYESPSSNPVPSAGNFRSDIHDLMVDLVRFLKANNAPFVVNIYPYLSLYQNSDFPVEFAFFEGSKGIRDGKTNVEYDNMFDANYDTLVWSLRKAKVGDLKIIVGEAGWPTDGDKNANARYAEKFYAGLLKKLASKKGTPLKPGGIEVYLFGLFDENMKSIAPGPFERHWGIFTYDGLPKFPMDLSGRNNSHHFLVPAKGIEYLTKQWCVYNPDAKAEVGELVGQLDYACSRADCTPIAANCSCGSLDQKDRVSYAFNIYFQMSDQDVRACDFGGLAKLSSVNASKGSCLFPVYIVSGARRVGGSLVAVVVALVVMVVMGM